MSQAKKRAAQNEKSSAARRLKPTQVATHNRPKSHVTITTLRHLLDTEPFFAMTAIGPSAYEMSDYIKRSQRVLAAVVQAKLKVDGSLSRATQRNGARRVATVIAHHMDHRDIERLKRRRTEWHNYLKQQTAMLLRAPPSSGGATAMWTLGTGLWLLICHANLVLKCNGVGLDMLSKFTATESRYLTRNMLALFAQPIGTYSLAQLVMTVLNAIERLDSLDSFDVELAAFVTLLEYRCGELICLSGTALTGYDAKQWLEPTLSGKAEQCSTRFVSHSMCWFLALHHYIDAHATISGVLSQQQQSGNNGADDDLPTPDETYVSVRQTYALSWFPTPDMRERMRRFFYEYAHGMTDQRYNIAFRAFADTFLALPCDANIYRLHAQSEEALTRNVLNHAAMTHHSPTGLEYMRTIMCMTPLVGWLHESVNWHSGDTSIRSAALGRPAFFRELAAIYVIHQYMCKHAVRFRFRFVLFHRSPAFFVNFVKAKRNGWPFIVQQFSRWCVVVPHRVDPLLDAREIEREMLSMSTRAARQAEEAVPAPPEQPVAANAQNVGADRMQEDEEQPNAVVPNEEERANEEKDGDGDSESYSYSYYSEDDDAVYDSADSDDDGELSRLLQPHIPPEIVRAQAAARAAIEPAPDAPAEELDDFAAELARMVIEMEGDERGVEERMEAYRTYGELLPPEAADERRVRVYECETFLDAFTLWAVALMHVNRGYIDKRRYTEFFATIFGWPERGASTDPPTK